MADCVIRKDQNSIAQLTLNRPEKLNALNYETNDRLLSLLNEIEDDSRIRAVVVTGAGDRAFSAGADIHEFSKSIRAGTDVAIKDFVRRGQAMTSRFESFPKPVIAAVNGLAFGGGCELTEAVHLAVASREALFAKPEISIGITPTFGGTQRLSRLAGRKRALEFLLTGDPFTAQRAYEIGLVNQVVPQEAVIDHAFAMAERILHHSPPVISAILHAVTRGVNLTIAEALEIEVQQFARVAGASDTRKRLDGWIANHTPRAEPDIEN